MFYSLLLTGEFIEYNHVPPLFPALPLLPISLSIFTLAYTRYASFVHVLPFNSFIRSLCAWSVFSFPFVVFRFVLMNC